MRKCGKNTVEQDETTNGNIIRRMRFACSITKAMDTLRVCNTYCFSIATKVELKRFAVTLYAHCLSCAYCTEWVKVLNIHT